MVTDALLDMLETAVAFFLEPLPDWSDDPFSTWGTVLGHLGDINYYLPVSEVFLFTLSIIVLAPLLMGINFGVWLLALLRGGSSRG
jgi:hypothetical protein